MLKAMIRTWATLVINYRWGVIGVTIVALGLSIFPMKNLYFDNSNELFFLKGDPNLVKFDQLLERFGDNEFLLIGVEARDDDETVFNENTLKMIDELTVFLEDHEVVTKVASLTKYQYMKSEDDVLDTIDLIEDIEEFPFTESELNKLAKVMKDEKLAIGSLLSEDLKHTQIVARTEYKKGESEHKLKIVNDLNQFLAEKNYASQGFDLHIGGAPLVSERFATVTGEDLSLIYPIMYSLMFIILFLTFRTLTGMVLPWLVVVGSLVVVIGIQGTFHWAFNTILTALPSIIVIMGIGDSVHIIAEFYVFRNKGLSPKESAIKAIESLWLPCFYTSLTTAAGFLALSVTKLVPIKHLGVLGALGAFMAFLFSLTVLPAILSFLKRIPKATQRSASNGLVIRMANYLVGFTYRYRKPLSWSSLVLFVISAVLASQISIDTNYVNYFKEGMKVRQDIEYFDTVYNGGVNIDFMIDSGSEGGVKEPEFLREVLKLQTYLNTLEGTGKSNSLVDYILKMSQSMNNDDPAYYTLPSSRELVAQYLLLYENTGPEEDLTDLKSFDERYLHVTLPISNMSATETAAVLDQIRNELKTNHAGLKVELTGGMVLFNAQDVYSREGMIQSFSIAILVVALCFFVLFRSIKYGLLALVPSILPIISAGGVLYLLGIDLDLGTMIVGAMTIGIAVDDSIHVMNRYLQAHRSGYSVQESIRLALTESGRAVVFTSIILITGFSTNMLGTFTPFVYTGIFSAIIMFLALVGDLLLLPALLYTLDDKKEAQQAEMVSPTKAVA